MTTVNVERAEQDQAWTEDVWVDRAGLYDHGAVINKVQAILGRFESIPCHGSSRELFERRTTAIRDVFLVFLAHRSFLAHHRRLARSAQSKIVELAEDIEHYLKSEKNEHVVRHETCQRMKALLERCVRSFFGLTIEELKCVNPDQCLTVLGDHPPRQCFCPSIP